MDTSKIWSAPSSLGVTSRFAPVAPPKILKRLKEGNLLGDYHLLLAHDVAQQTDIYKAIFGDGKNFIIMDNSLIELGYPCPADMMKKAYDTVHPNVVVLPDHLLQAEKTKRDSMEAMAIWSRMGMDEFLVVVQGQTEIEIAGFITHFMQIQEVKMWSVPRVIVEQFGTRRNIINLVNALDGTRPIHLLGFSDNTADDIACSHMHNVAGIDSAVPIRMGLHEVVFDPSNHDIGKTPPRGDYWERTEINHIVRHNMKVVQEWTRLHQ